ncbi:hypothetical protein ACN28S_66075 [Cystobacter fuscus]
MGPMNRAVLFLFLVLVGCNRGEAVRAIIQIDPALKASCVVLEVRTPEESSVRNPRPSPARRIKR